MSACMALLIRVIAALKALIEQRDGLVSSLRKKGKSTDASVSTLDSAVNVVTSLHKELMTLDGRITAEEAKVEDASSELRAITGIVKSDIGDQAVAIERLIEVTTMLEFKALGVSMAHDIQMHFLLMLPCS